MSRALAIEQHLPALYEGEGAALEKEMQAVYIEVGPTYQSDSTITKKEFAEVHILRFALLIEFHFDFRKCKLCAHILCHQLKPISSPFWLKI